MRPFLIIPPRNREEYRAMCGDDLYPDWWWACPEPAFTRDGSLACARCAREGTVCEPCRRFYEDHRQ